jgi:hypothetical protein
MRGYGVTLQFNPGVQTSMVPSMTIMRSVKRAPGRGCGWQWGGGVGGVVGNKNMLIDQRERTE